MTEYPKHGYAVRGTDLIEGYLFRNWTGLPGGDYERYDFHFVDMTGRQITEEKDHASSNPPRWFWFDRALAAEWALERVREELSRLRDKEEWYSRVAEAGKAASDEH